jgi:hypothetical protein
MMYNDLDKPLYDAEATKLFPNDAALLVQRPSPHGTTLTDLSAESGSSAAHTPPYKFSNGLPSNPNEVRALAVESSLSKGTDVIVGDDFQ